MWKYKHVKAFSSLVFILIATSYRPGFMSYGGNVASKQRAIIKCLSAATKLCSTESDLSNRCTKF